LNRYGVDLTACWRPEVGMVTLSLELTRALVHLDAAQWTLLCSRERPASLNGQGQPEVQAVLSPHRHELANKLAWIPFVESEAGLDAVLYPYWPSPPWRRAGAPPAAVFIHDLAFRVRPSEVPWQQRFYMGSLVPPALRAAAAVMVPSQATRRDVLESYPLAGLEEKLEVVPAGPSNLAGQASALPHGLEPGFLLAVGTVEPRKNYDRLLDAYRLLRARIPAPALVVAGRPGWEVRSTLEALATEPGVVYLGHVPGPMLLALYQNAGLLAFPSLYEGFGLPLLDAMCQGLPALVGERGSLSELAAGAALVVDPEDTDAIAAGLERLLSDAELRRRLIEAGRRRSAEFTWESAARSTLEILGRIALSK
jgi:glycosyltransferase involved in cell wall biosynthesis